MSSRSEPLSPPGGDDAFAGASMVDSATSGIRAFGNGTLGEPPAAPPAPLQAPPAEATGYDRPVNGITYVNGYDAGGEAVRESPGRGSSTLDPSTVDPPTHDPFDPSGRDSADSADPDSAAPDAAADDSTAEDWGVEDPGWAAALRGIGRVGAWALPLGAAGLAWAALWSWPAAGVGTNRPGTWLVITVGSFAFALLGVVSLAALLLPTAGRRWAVAGAAAVALGAMLVAPILGVLGLARPAVTNSAENLGGSVDALHANMIDNVVGRWLLVGGLTLLAAGVCLLGIAVLASGLLARFDGYLLVAGVGLAVFASWAKWQFLLVIAAIVLLAAGLGLAWTATRVTPDGRSPVTDD